MRRTRKLIPLLAGGLVLLGGGSAFACASAPAHPKPAGCAPRAREAGATGGTLHAARCTCESRADCTCKKGECRCRRCHKPLREEAEGRQAAATGPLPSGAAPLDAGAALVL